MGFHLGCHGSLMSHSLFQHLHDSSMMLRQHSRVQRVNFAFRFVVVRCSRYRHVQGYLSWLATGTGFKGFSGKLRRWRTSRKAASKAGAKSRRAKNEKSQFLADRGSRGTLPTRVSRNHKKPHESDRERENTAKAEFGLMLNSPSTSVREWKRAW